MASWRSLLCAGESPPESALQTLLPMKWGVDSSLSGKSLNIHKHANRLSENPSASLVLTAHPYADCITRCYKSRLTVLAFHTCNNIDMSDLSLVLLRTWTIAKVGCSSAAADVS